MTTKNDKTVAEDEELKFKKDLALLEAALYVAGRPLDVKTLGYIIKTRSKKRIHQLARALIEKYEQKETPLEVLKLEDERYVLQLKTEYSSKVRKLAIRPLLSDGPLRTLAYIAYRQPILQKQVIDARGAHAYLHIRQLIDMELVERENNGRHKILRVTDFFADYFGLSRNPRLMKHQLKKTFNDLMKTSLPSLDEKNNLDESKQI